MAIKLQRPILAGAIGLTFTAWLLDLLTHSLWQSSGSEVGIVGIGAVAVGASLWLRRKPTPIEVRPEASTEAVNRLLAETQQIIEHLEASGASQAVLRAKVGQVAEEMSRKAIRIAVIGSSSVGKTSLLNVLEAKSPSQRSYSFQELPSLFAPDSDLAPEQLATEADLVLFAVQADLTAPEHQTLKELVARHKRTLIVLTKLDQYLPSQQTILLKQLQLRSQGILAATDVVAIAAAPRPVKVRQHQVDGLIQEQMEYPQPQVESLNARLEQVVAQEAEQLILQTTLDHAIALKATAQSGLNALRRDLALPIVEQYQWVAAATAFANPLPTLDLLAAAAITGKMVVELGAVYQQKLSLAQAQAVASTLAGFMVKLGLVEFSTQTLGSLLKSHSVTYVAGGAVQGVSAAYLTRLAGLSLIEHFQTLSASSTHATPPLLEGLSQTLQAVFQQNQRLAFLKSLISQALSRLRLTPIQVLTSQTQELKLEENKVITCVSVDHFESTPIPSI